MEESGIPGMDIILQSSTKKRPLKKRAEPLGMAASKSFTIEPNRTINEYVVKYREGSHAGLVAVYPLHDGEDAFLLDNENEICLAMHMRRKLPNIVRFFNPDNPDKSNIDDYKFIGDLAMHPGLLDKCYEFRYGSKEDDSFLVNHTRSLHKFIVTRGDHKVASFTMAGDTIDVSLDTWLSDLDAIILLGIAIATCQILRHDCSR